ncbi:MAG: O-antigen ligase family protein [Bacteroidetes bacterium]|nr:O-antigen ligase family protein [Bacteroidota bacterium]
MRQPILTSAGRWTPSPESRIAALLVAGVFMPPFLQVLVQALWLGTLWRNRRREMQRGDQHRSDQHLSGQQVSFLSRLSLPAWAQILLGLWTLLSLLWTTNQSEGWTEIISKIPLFTWPIAFALADPNSTKLRSALLRWTWISSGLVGLICVVDVLLRSQAPAFWFADLVYENLARISGLHPIYLSVWVLMGMLAYLQDRVVGPEASAPLAPPSSPSPATPPSPRSSPSPCLSWRQGLFHTLYLGGSLVFLTQLSSRMALLTALLVLTASVFFLARTGRLRLFHLPLLLLALLLPWALINGNQVNQSRYQEMVNLQGTYQSDRWGGRALRIQKWKYTLHCYLQFPLVGTGAGDFQKELLDIYRQNDFVPGFDNRFNSHNQYLQTLATLGPLGLALLLACLFLPLRWHWEDRYWLGIATVLLVAASMLTESLLERQKGIYIVGLLANGYFCFRQRPSKPGTLEPPPPQAL